MFLHIQTNTVIRKCVLILLLAFPVITFAAPGPIDTIEIEYDAGDVIISWDPPAEKNIIAYNVYYSNESILENEGAYDDFESTVGPTTFYTFTDLTPGKKYYFSVLAVDENNEESAGFVKEVSITVPQTNASSDDVFQLPTKQQFSSISSASSAVSSVSSVSSSATESSTVKLISANATSPTEIQLVFSGMIDVADEAAPDAFAIVTPTGVRLPITNLQIIGEDVRLTTGMQAKGTVYEVQLSGPIVGYPDNEPLDETARRAFFIGHADSTGVTPEPPASSVSSQPSSQNNGNPNAQNEVQNIRVSSIPEGNGSNKIVIEWDVPTLQNGLAYYMVSQSYNNGLSFTEPTLLAAGIGGVELPGITASVFGVKINTVDQLNNVSAGVYQPIQVNNLGNYQPPASQSSSVVYTPPIVGSVTQPPAVTGKGGSNLPQTGATFVLITMGLAGMIAGTDRMRKVQR